MSDIRIKDLPLGTPTQTKKLPMDLSTTENATIKDIVFAGRPTASQAEAEAGVEAEKAMTPLLTKQAVNFQVSLAGRTGDYNDLSNRPDVPAVRQIPFSVSVGQASVAIEDGYDIGTVYQVYLNGLLLDNGSWTATDGVNVAFPAITSDDVVEGESTASMVVAIGASSMMEPNWDARYNRRMAATSDEIGLNGSGDPSGNWAALMNASEDGRPLIFTKPAVAYAFDDEIFIDGPDVDWTGYGYPEFRNEMEAGSDAKNIVHIKSPFSKIRGLKFNGQAHIKNFVQPALLPSGTTPVHGHNLVIGGDNSIVQNIITMHAHDNGLTMGSFDVATGLHDRNPLGIKVLDSHSRWNGEGEHVGATPGKIGAGFSNANCKQAMMANLTDYQSYIGFIADVGAGAQMDAVNLHSWDARKDTRYADNGSGYGFYAGAAGCNWLNCSATFSQYMGAWMDGPDNNWVNFTVNITGFHGIRLNAPARLKNLRVSSVGQIAANTFDAVFMPIGADTDIFIDGFEVKGDRHRYALYSTGPNNSRVRVYVRDDKVRGHMTGDYFTDRSNHQHIRQGVNLSGDLSFIGLPSAGTSTGQLYRDSNGFLKVN